MTLVAAGYGIAVAPTTRLAGYRCQGIALRPLFGIGWHYLEADFDRLASYPDSSGLAFGLAGGAELELSPYVFAGLMGEVGIYGVPGDTHGEDTSLWIYAGVRF